MQNHFAQFIPKLQPPADFKSDCCTYSLMSETEKKCFSLSADRCLRAIKSVPCSAICWDSQIELSCTTLLQCLDIDCKYSISQTHLALPSHPWNNARLILPYLGHPALTAEPRTTLGWEQGGRMGYIHLSKCQNLDNKPKLGSNSIGFILSGFSVSFQFYFAVLLW